MDIMDHETAIQVDAPLRYVIGELSDEERDGFEEHFADCKVCMNDVQMASAFAANAKEVLRERPVRGVVVKRAPWRFFQPVPRLAFSAAFNILLVAGLGYQLLHVDSRLRSQLSSLSQPENVEITPVPGVVRGAGAHVIVASGPVQVLSFPLLRQYVKFDYSITEKPGPRKLTGELNAKPGAGAVNLSIPVATLDTGTYEVIVTGIDGALSEEVGSTLLQVPGR